MSKAFRSQTTMEKRMHESQIGSENACENRSIAPTNERSNEKRKRATKTIVMIERRNSTLQEKKNVIDHVISRVNTSLSPRRINSIVKIVIKARATFFPAKKENESHVIHIIESGLPSQTRKPNEL